MKVKEKGHTLIVKCTEESVSEFMHKLKEQYKDTFHKQNLVVDLSEQGQKLTESELMNFEELAVKHQQEANKSFVLVASDIDFNKFDEELIIVPTLQEAFDLIEMDEIERDLGF